MERTLIIAKPDAVQRGLTGEIIRRFEQRGLRIVGLKFMSVSRTLAEQHYDVHRGKPFFEGLVTYMSSSPVVVMALEVAEVLLVAGLGASFLHLGRKMQAWRAVLMWRTAASVATWRWRSDVTWCMARTAWRTRKPSWPCGSRRKN